MAGYVSKPSRQFPAAQAYMHMANNNNGDRVSSLHWHTTGYPAKCYCIETELHLGS